MLYRGKEDIKTLKPKHTALQGNKGPWYGWRGNKKMYITNT